jgi:hypothetical protein
MNAKVKRSLS